MTVGVAVILTSVGVAIGVMAVTVDEIREMARKYLTPQNRTVVTVVPRQATSAAESTTP